MIVVEHEIDNPRLTPYQIDLRGKGSAGTLWSVQPTGIERWVVYLVTGGKNERIWAIDHLEFDFLQGGLEPLHVLATHLENRTAIVVYKEHGATQAILLRKDDPPPTGTGLWTLVDTHTILDDGDLEGCKATHASVSGRVEEEEKVAFAVTLSAPGRTPTKYEVDLLWLANGDRHWRVKLPPLR